MPKRLSGLAIGLSAISFCIAAAAAPPLTAQTPPAAPAASPPAGKLDPVAIQALTGMGKYLMTLKSFELNTKATLERQIDESDMKLSFSYEGHYEVARPNGFHIEMKSDRQVRDFYFDGKNFTVFIPREKAYATVATPGKIVDAVDAIYDKYGISLPLADLFYWADAGAPTDGLSTAMHVGYAKVNGQEADQFFYRGDDLDFQIWIARGAKPLPLRIAITTRSSPAKPSYVADLTWNTAPSFAASSFTFRPGAGTSAIDLATVSQDGEQ
ncbi:DUF2092 domain-containing protein [Sphingobium sp. AP49]|uniref:DUF2092 domain-containing protein n=1 Tax=Sphingobium sp. AP49 TaxID=1144307 RepID=UPI00026EC8FC|nr:DUF2092 domain-containing protein [Sphingobium sp. AP49]WHO39884.1 DUF2092 domain-containing protein [Sphingobium sp. AP49]